MCEITFKRDKLILDIFMPKKKLKYVLINFVKDILNF